VHRRTRRQVAGHGWKLHGLFLAVRVDLTVPTGG
jgi:hypothetical protein